MHWNKKYETPNVAAGKPDGLAVLGMLIEIGEKHEEFDKVVQALAKIPCKNDKTCLEEAAIDCAKLLPENKALWTYEGSLTTPPLLESVIWTVFQTPMKISADQVLKAIHVLKVMTSQNRCMKLSHCPKYEQNIREISALEDYIDQVCWYM